MLQLTIFWLILLSAINLILAASSYGFRKSEDSPSGFSIGGSYIQNGECPWLCPVYEKSEYLCGSSLISNQFVLTAAHCILEKDGDTPVPSSDLFIYTGIYDLNDKSNAKIVPAQDVKMHPNWDALSNNYDADIALIKLLKFVQFSQFVQKIPLPSSAYIQEEVNGFVVGYGASETEKDHESKPRRIKIPIIGGEDCRNSHRILAKTYSANSFCAGKHGVVPCAGDSGSGFYLLKNQSPVLVGVVSSGIKRLDRKCKEDAYVIFTDVFKFLSWIKAESDVAGSA